ncbi:MAG: methionyl-tRNA formyltransferase [Marinilabiliales bacterium]|nr:MAG: methionyl-tRNA formyltransferase [Marinilabiliales bacterium]
MNIKDLKIVFMGTPEFAVGSLSKLIDNGFNIVGVITSADKPAGRGKKLKYSDVKKYAIENNLNLLQPTNLKSPEFIAELESLNADLQIVVAFRMLPEIVWDMPPLGTFNLHASLLPQYRGAAPINHVIINGEKVTGATTFFLDKEIDTGKIIKQVCVEISENDNAGSLHDKLMDIGGDLVVETANDILNNSVESIPQKLKISEGEKLLKAPKIFKEDCRIEWSKNVDDIYNFIRGLSPYPAAYTELINEAGEKVMLKIFNVSRELAEVNIPIGTILIDKDNFKISCSNGFLFLQELQQSGKKRMHIIDFLRGTKLDNSYKAI